MHIIYNMDMEQNRMIIENYFHVLGLSSEIAHVYLCLQDYGPQTISELSRRSGIERTRLYRLLPDMQNQTLVEIDSEYKHGIISAAPIDNLSILVAKKEQEVAYLQQELPSLKATLTKIQGSSHEAGVKFYRGVSGVKQLLWNETNAKSELLSLLPEGIQIKTDSKFFERWATKCNDRELTFRSIVNGHFQPKQSKWYETHYHEKLHHWNGKVVSDELFLITHGTLIYDDILAYFQWNEREVFGVEIKSADLAQTQRQFFALLWMHPEAQKIDE